MRNPIKILQQSAMTVKADLGRRANRLPWVLRWERGDLCVFAAAVAVGVGIALLIKSIWFIAIAGAIWVFGPAFHGYVSSVASHVYRCALYLYAPKAWCQNLTTKICLTWPGRSKGVPRNSKNHRSNI